MNKPNKQTIVLQSGLNDLLVSTPISKLPKMGGKNGNNLGKKSLYVMIIFNNVV